MESPTDIIRQTYDEQLERIKIALADRNLAKVAKQTMLHENTVRSIANGSNKMPSITTIDALAGYLFK